MAFPFFGGPARHVTLLFVTPQRLVRADFTRAGGPTLTQLWQAPAPPGELLPLLTESALLLGPVTQRGEAYVITSTVATQFISVPTPKVGGLEGDELIRALSFEAEALSGLNPFDSALGAIAQGESSGERQFWITQMPSSELQQIDDMLHRHKLRLAGILHAGGLPRNVEPGAAGEPWQRVEVWNDAVFCVDTSASGTFKLHLIPSPPSRANWQPEADSWFKGCGPSMRRETLVSDTAQLSGAGASGGHSLAEEQVLRTFLTSWAKELILPRARIPVIRPAARPMPDSYRWAITAALTGAVALLCGAHWFWLKSQEKRLAVDFAQAQIPATRLGQFRSETTALEAQLVAVNGEIASMRSLLEDWKDGVTREHRRHASLLGALLTNTPPGLMIHTITEKLGELRIQGVSLTSSSAGFGNGIAAGMEPFFWTIDPPRRRAMALTEEGGPWQLEWLLRPYGKSASTTNMPVGVATSTLLSN